MTSSVSFTSQPDSIQYRLTVFTKKFVEAVLTELQQIKQNGEVGSSPKPEKSVSGICTAAGGVAGGATLPIEPSLASGIAKATKTGVEHLCTQIKADKIKQRCRKVVDTFRFTTTNDIIKILVDAGCALFESFEEPFMRVVGEPNAQTSWAHGLEKLACDAKDRLINSIVEDKSFTLSPECVFRAVLSGKSNNSSWISNFNVRGSLSGHSIIINSMIAGNQTQKTLKTSEVFEKFDLAVVRSDGRVEKVYEKAKPMSKPCSLRRVHLFDHPDVLNDFVKQKEIVSYLYILTKNILESIAKEIYDTLHREDPDVRFKDTLEEVRVTGAKIDTTLLICKEAQDEVRQCMETTVNTIEAQGAVITGTIHSKIEHIHQHLDCTGSKIIKILTEKEIDKCLPRKELLLKAKEFLTLKVKLCGEETEVQAAFPTITIKEIITLLNLPAAQEEFEDWKSKNSALELDSVLSETSPLYIPRRISNRVELDPEVFKRDSPDIFVFRGLSKDELKSLVAPHYVASSTDQLTIITCRHIFLDDEYDWDDLAQRAKAPLHLIAKEVRKNTALSNEEIFVVAKSTKASPLLQEACQKMPERRRDVYISENEFVDTLLHHVDFNGACLCDVPGMGKSWLMQSLARKLRNLSHNSQVFSTNLSSLSEYLEQNNKTRKDDPLLALLNHLYSTSLAAFLIYRHIIDSNIPVFLFLDGYDEILDSRLKRTNSIMQSMHSSQSNVKMIITSRPNVRATLEENFGVISYDILSFDTAEQISAMTSIWQQKFPNHDLIKLEEYAAHCAMITKNIKASNDLDILGVPLKCYLLAIVCENNAGQFSNPNRRKKVNISELAISVSVFDLYQQFVDTILKKLEVAEEKEFDNDSWRESVLYYHTLHALNLLYPDIGTEFSAILPEQELSEHELTKIGMLSLHGSKISFIHRTFAEYFVGRFVADLLTCSGQINTAIAIARKLFLTKLLCTYSSRMHFMDNQVWRYLTGTFPGLKIHEFNETTVLWFMDRRLLSNPQSSSFSHKEVNNLTESHIEVDTDQLPSTWSPDIDALFEDNLFQILICCIREGYHRIFRLIMHIWPANHYKKYFTTIFRSKSASNLVTTPIKRGAKNSELVAVCILLLQLAQYASEETAYEIYNLFTQSGINFFRQIFQRSSLALKHGIVSATLEDSYYKNSRDWFIPFLIETKIVEKSELPIFEFLKAVGHKSKSQFEDRLNSSSLAKAYSKWIQIKSILLKDGINMQTTSLQQKAQVMDYVLGEFRDSELVVILLELFGEEEESKKFWATQNINPNDLGDVSQSDVVNVRLWKAGEVLQAIDMKEANHVLSAMKSEYSHFWFSELRGLEILKVLLSIWKDMRNYALCNWDYLHYAVWYGNVNWVRYLLENDHDVNAIDEYGRTPLHLVKARCPIKITELLLEHGADVYAVDQGKRNVVHAYCEPGWNSEKSGIIEWTTFMLNRGHHELWSMKNSSGETPMDILARKNDVALYDEIASLVKKYEAMSQDEANSSK